MIYHYLAQTPAFTYSFYATKEEGDRIVERLNIERFDNDRIDLVWTIAPIRIVTYDTYFRG